MASNMHPVSARSRLTRFSLGRGLKGTESTHLQNPEPDPDYIPYNGPYEPPPDPPERDRDSWGYPVEGNREDDGGLSDRDYYERYGGDDRKYGHEVRFSNEDTVDGDHSRKSIGTSSVRARRGMLQPSYVNLDGTGGVGESPRPPRTSGERDAYSPTITPSNNRTSFASFFTFGQGSRKTAQTTSMPVQPELRHSVSTDFALSGKRGGRTVPQDEYYNSYYDTADSSQPQLRLPPRVQTQNLSPRGPNVDRAQARSPISPLSPLSPFSPGDEHQPFSQPQSPSARHPYAYTSLGSPSQARAPPISPSAVPYKPPQQKFLSFRRDVPTIKFSASAQGQQEVPGYLKPSPRGSLLGSFSTPNLRGLARSEDPTQQRRRPSPIPAQLKGKERWLSPETWCDALLFPRPRFKVRDSTPEEVEAEKARWWSRRVVSPPGSPVWPSPPRDRKRDEPPLSAASENVGPFAIVTGSMKGKDSIVHRLPKSRSAADLLSEGGWMLAGRSRGNTSTSESSGLRQPQVHYASPEERTETIAAPVVNTSEEVKLRPPRPKSFAQDDLALPSPIPSLTKVLEEGEQLEKDRKAWQQQATRSFQNKRTRSVSRMRAKSLTSTHPRVRRAPVQETFDLLAARTLLGSQASAPTVHARTTSSANNTQTGTLTTGIGTTSWQSRTANSHSRSHSHSHSTSQNSHSQTQHKPGHSRNGSWGKSALKAAKTAAALCGINSSDDLVTPVTEDPQEAVIVVSPAAVDGAFSPASAALAMVSRDGNSSDPHGPSPTPSGLGVPAEAVGLALSSPPPSDDHSRGVQELIRFPAHPYAMYATPRTAPVPEVVRPVPPKSDYAGPHPSSTQITLNLPLRADINDVSVRHRLPPHAILHPYAQGSHTYALPTSDQASSSRDPYDGSGERSRMYAQVPSGRIREVLPDEIRKTPSNSNSPAFPGNDSGGFKHACAAKSRPNSDALGMGEVLSYALRRRGSGDSGLGTSEGHGLTAGRDWDEDRIEILRNHAGLNAPGSSEQLLTIPDNRMKGNRPAFHSRLTQSSEPLSNHTIASSPLETLESQYPSFPPASDLSQYSPQHSPHAFGDDLERFRDLFYRPSPKETSRTPSSEKLKESPPHDSISSLPMDVSLPPRRRTGSGFTTLARQLSEELEALKDEAECGRPDSFNNAPPLPMLGSRHGGMKGQRPLHNMFDPCDKGGNDHGPTDYSPHMTTLPLRLPGDRGNTSTLEPTLNVPEDVASSRASSILDRSVEGDNTEMFRMGVVEAVLTPPILSSDHRVSAHLSLIDGEVGPPVDEDIVMGHSDSGQRIVSQSSLAPPHSAVTRSSYMTSTSSTSRMSGLSDFPSPPTLQATPGHIALMQSYFSETPQQQEDPFASVGTRHPRPNLVRQPSNTTFGD